MSAPVFILVRPQMGENIGACARAMWNFGLEELRVVDPRDGWPNARAVAMASGATHVLERARLTRDTAEATADLHGVYATTARPRELTKRVLTPERAAQEMRARIEAGERVGVLFGRERTGLENEDVIRANAIVTVPVNPRFPSLNLAQCALLMGYEWLRAGDATAPETCDPGPAGLAAQGDLDRFHAHLEAELAEAGFFWPQDKAPAMRAALRNLLSRLPLTDADLRMLWGVARSLARLRRRRGGG